jgi:putative membrane protein insertion efficiency factor
MMARGIACGVIRAYQFVARPMLPRACRFWPSCSEYARLAIEGHGVLRGGVLAGARILRCHPFHPGGYDPPPESRQARASGGGAEDGAEEAVGRMPGNDSAYARGPAEPEQQPFPGGGLEGGRRRPLRLS